MSIEKAIALSVACVLCVAGRAATWYVNDANGNDLNSGSSWTSAKKSIQGAIDVASDGDGVLVAKGVYGAIDASEVQVNIKSAGGPFATVIDGAGSKPAAILANSMDSPQSTLTGFTLRNGFLNECGAGVLCGYVYNCVVSNCVGYAAIHGCKAYNTIIVRNRLTKDYSKWYGAAMHSSLYNCVVADNDGYAAAWDCGCYNSVVLGGLYIATASSGGVECFYNCCLSTMKADSWTISSGRGNFVADPLFVNRDAGDYSLAASSPCIDAGNNSYTNCACDIAGRTRVHNDTVDIGAYEWGSSVPAGIENIVACQRYPWNGMVDLSFTVTGESTNKYEVSFVAKDVVGNTNLTMRTLADEKGSLQPATNVLSPGTYRWTWNAAADLADGLACDRVTVTGTVEEHVGGVQLWENGPYWAECNVGATKPEEYGYYFWWGDTVGYERNANNDGWVSVSDGTSFNFMPSSIHTFNKNCSTLQSEGYVDPTGNLVATHDAATARLGAPWRMPTDAECSDLANNCTTTWTSRSGVSGQCITGKGVYAAKSIFLPAVGYGIHTNLYHAGSRGMYFSSTACADDSTCSWSIFLVSVNSAPLTDQLRYFGQTVRPVRASVK